MKEHRLGIIMNGVTGRMGSNQHLMRAIAAIHNEGWLAIQPGEVVLPDPVLVGAARTNWRPCPVSLA